MAAVAAPTLTIFTLPTGPAHVALLMLPAPLEAGVFSGKHHDAERKRQRHKNRGRHMFRTALAMLVASLVLLAVNGSAKAAPIPPLAAGITASVSDVTDVSWRRCWRDRWGACAVGDFQALLRRRVVQLGRLSRAMDQINSPLVGGQGQ